MVLTLDQIKAGLIACKHYAEAYPLELTADLCEFIRVIEVFKKELEV